MAYDVQSQQWSSLQARYREMSDGELLDLAASPDELTEVAQQVLRGEMSSRKLKLEAPQAHSPIRWASDAFVDSLPQTGISTSILGSGPALEEPAESETLAANETLLGLFYDAIEVGRMCECLEEAAVPFRIEDVSQRRAVSGAYDTPPVALNVIVAKTDRERAMAVLRSRMGLFPLQEVAEADALIDDGTLSQVGFFATHADAEVIASALESAHLWHRIVANPEGSLDTEDAFVVEVKEVDLLAAGDVIEKALK